MRYFWVLTWLSFRDMVEVCRRNCIASYLSDCMPCVWITTWCGKIDGHSHSHSHSQTRIPSTFTMLSPNFSHPLDGCWNWDEREKVETESGWWVTWQGQWWQTSYQVCLPVAEISPSKRISSALWAWMEQYQMSQFLQQFPVASHIVEYGKILRSVGCCGAENSWYSPQLPVWITFQSGFYFWNYFLLEEGHAYVLCGLKVLVEFRILKLQFCSILPLQKMYILRWTLKNRTKKQQEIVQMSLWFCQPKYARKSKVAFKRIILGWF